MRDEFNSSDSYGQKRTCLNCKHHTLLGSQIEKDCGSEECEAHKTKAKADLIAWIKSKKEQNENGD